ncbi:MAG: hypothetical protein KDA24_30150, partial [Deltaproteobacteria bacterium]|nr:hypothetical protein [Deltaproteobacteria bacterium]
MTRTRIAALVIVLLGLGFAIWSRVTPSEAPAVSAKASPLTKRGPPPDLKRPQTLEGELIRGGKHPEGPPPGDIPQMAPPPLDPTPYTGEDGEPRSAWPLTKDGFMGAMEEATPAVRECYDG